MNLNQLIKLLEINGENKNQFFIELNYRNQIYIFDIYDIKQDFIKYNILHLPFKPYVMELSKISIVRCICNNQNKDKLYEWDFDKEKIKVK